jgi:hypothetical protein
MAANDATTGAGGLEMKDIMDWLDRQPQWVKGMVVFFAGSAVLGIVAALLLPKVTIGNLTIAHHETAGGVKTKGQGTPEEKV